MKEKLFETFDVYNVPLEGKNLVEASAGTGKTFSIGILVLRLVLEKNIPIEKILMVTFTNNAVAELEERLRLFIRDAHDYALNNKPVKETISQVVDSAINISGKNSIVQKLKDALLFLDQLSVMTIHGFCQQTLSNQAFETGQIFGVQLVTTMDDIYEQYVNEFWRIHINTLPVELYRSLRAGVGLTTYSILNLLKNYYAGKVFFNYHPGRQYQLSTDTFLNNFETISQRAENNFELFNNYLNDHRSELEADMNANGTAKKYVENLESADDMWEYISQARKEGKKYIQKVFANTLLPFFNASDDINGEKEEVNKELLNNIYCFALYQITPRVNAHMQAGGFVSFDGLIRNLHNAISGPNKKEIVSELQSKYDAVFVDEFQDTDKLQYEIFKTAFHTGTTLFYIGDPKQSIYAFRQADINTYLSAYQDVDRLYSMNTNYRSTQGFVLALNQFFLPKPDFDTFLFNEQERPIRYIKVEAPEQPVENDLFHGAEKDVPLSILYCKNYGEVTDALTDKVLELLTDTNYTIYQERIKPSDIGILVADNKYGKAIKAALNKKNIPAIVLNDDKVMQSDEATALYYVLRAMHNPTVENINTGLLNQFTGKTSKEIISYKKEELVSLFRNYKAQWESRGINLAISSWMKDFGIGEYLIRTDTENGLRIISNLEQLKELLIKTEYLQRMNPDELLDWMKRAKDLELLDEDESIIRLENDADAVTIITIHRAKGLQYKIVFVPQADLTIKDPDKLGLLSLYQNGDYILIPGNQMDERQIKTYEQQAQQEKRRLLYVALTRGIYAGYVYKNEQFQKKSTLTDFLKEIRSDNLIQIEKFENAKDKDNSARYIPENFKHARTAKLKSTFSLQYPNWRFMSYSALTPEHGYTPLLSQEKSDSDYDKFIFETLRKGSITGTMIHEILEKIDFQNDENHIYPIQNAIGRYASSNAELYLKYLPDLIQHILLSIILAGDCSFQLKDISAGKQLHELEFDFPVNSFSTQQFIEVCKTAGIEIALKTTSDLYGMMNGFIDMFFEHQGKFYVLDWKSNHLGNVVSNYTGQLLQEAMTNNNYHLQYLIYTLAVCKYLKQRLSSFDYDKQFGGIIYCFVRGMRKEKESGVFFVRPEKQFVAEIDSILNGQQSLING